MPDETERGKTAVTPATSTARVLDDLQEHAKRLQPFVNSHATPVTYMALDGTILLANLAAAQIVVVLLDLSMPRMDGRATLEELRRIDPDVRVVLTSGFDQTDAAARVDVDDRVTFLAKPASYDQLLDAIDRVTPSE